MSVNWIGPQSGEFNRIPQFDSQSVFVLGNGPSLGRHDLDSLVGIPTFASNAIYLIFERTVWRPDVYACVDTAVLPDRKREISSWADRLEGTSFFFPSEIYTHESPEAPVNVAGIIRPRKNVFYFKTRPLDLGGPQKDVFGLAGDGFVVEPMTVTVTLLQIAVKLGAKRVFLAGCDTDYIIPAGARILDQDSSRIDKRIVLDEDNDPNHFDPSYFGRGKVWHTPNQALMLQHYRRAKEVCDENGIEIFNAGIGGKLDVFPRIDFQDAVSDCSTA